MTNPYYNPSGVPAQGATVASPAIRTEYAALQTAFDKLPILVSNAYKVLRVKSDESGFEASGLTIDVSGRLTAPAGLTVSGGTFVSRGITDNATATTLTIGSTGLISIGGPEVATCPLAIYSATSANFIIQGDSTAQITLQRYSSDTTPPTISFRKTRGTLLSQSAVASGDNIASIAFNAWGGSNARLIAGIVAKCDTYVSDTDISSYVTINTSPQGAALYTENFRVWKDGTITLGGASTTPALKVVPDATPATQRSVIVTAGSAAGNPTIGTSAGSLSLTAITNTILAGTTGANNYLQLFGNASGNSPGISVAGVDASISFSIGSKGTGNVALTTGGGTQALVADTATANRYITLTGSNGGNPTIGTSGGNLAISSALIPAGLIDAGSYIAASNATATPAGGTAGSGFYLGSARIEIIWGSGAPNKTCAAGSIYLRTDGAANTRLYSTSGGGTWFAITSA